MKMHADDLISEPVLSKLIIAAKFWWVMMLQEQIENLMLKQSSITSHLKISLSALINEKTYAYCAPSGGTECENHQLEKYV
jgi:hypothetical protein